MSTTEAIFNAAIDVVCILRRANMKHCDAAGRILRTGWFICQSEELADALCKYDAIVKQQPKSAPTPDLPLFEVAAG